MSLPAISIVIPIYNCGPYLREALASMRWQTFTDWECICVNDGSTDTTREILADFAAVDSRFRVFHQENQGIVGALNHGFSKSRADWIVRMDGDDIALPERFEKQFAYVKKHTDVIALGTQMLYVTQDGAPIHKTNYAKKHEPIANALQVGHEAFAHGTTLLHRETVLRAGSYRNDFEWVEDAELWLRMIDEGQLANLDYVGLLYRQHEASICWTRREEQRQRRSLLFSLGKSSPRKKKTPRSLSPASGKWARRAAKAGYYRTAWNQWRQLISEQPFAMQTVRLTAETIFRASVSFGTGKRGEVIPMPDWREWDCRRDALTKKRSLVA